MVLGEVKNMERELVKKFRLEKAVNLLSYAKLTEKVERKGELLTVWTKALQTAIQENSFVYIPKGKYYLDDSIILSSNKKIKASKKAEIILLESCKKVLLRNIDVIDGSYTNIPSSEPKTENLFIEGGIWRESRTTRLGYGKTGAYDDEDSLHGVTCTMLFSGVKNLVLRNLTFKNSAGFSVQIGRCENFEVKNIRFINCFADGVHVNGDVKNGYIYNIHGEVGDDLVALNAYDWDNSTINNGAIENLCVNKVYSTAKGEFYKAFRIQPGVIEGKNGEIDCYIKDVRIKNIKGVSVFKMYLQTPSYRERPDGAKVGRIENIRFEHIEVYQDGPVDQMDNYKYCDKITGHFGVFELGSNITKLYFNGVKVKMNEKDYPTAHLITVGPKSCYFEKEKIELFDPYVECLVKEVYYKNVRINGRKINDLKAEAKEVRFDKLYETENSFGFGKLEGIQSLK